MGWTPTSRAELEALIDAALEECDEAVRAEWQRIRIEPEKWQCRQWGDAGGGFWAVAIDDGRVLWLNDIEDGFNWSPFSQRGTIGEYRSGQSGFDSVLEDIAQRQAVRGLAALRESDVPDELAGPGVIGRRQTTNWELCTTASVVYRVHFEDKVEFSYAAAEYPAVELLSEHPLLGQHNEPQASLFFSEAPADPSAVTTRLEHLLRDASAGWRGLADYGGGAEQVERQLRAGFGKLLEAPVALCVEAGAALEAAGVRSSVVAHVPTESGMRVLLMGRSYVIARRFFFERCSNPE